MLTGKRRKKGLKKNFAADFVFQIASRLFTPLFVQYVASHYNPSVFVYYQFS